MISCFSNWLLSPARGAEKQSLRSALDCAALDESVTTLSFQEERSQQILQLAAESLGRQELVAPSFWHFRARVKRWVLKSVITKYVEYKKSQQVANLFRTICQKADKLDAARSLKDRVQILKSADAKNALFTDDELRLFCFDQARDLALSKQLNIGHDYIPFSFDKITGSSCLPMGCPFSYSFSQAMQALQDEAYTWELEVLPLRDIHKFRKEIQLDKISPKLLRKFEKALNDDLTNLENLSREEKQLLQDSQHIYSEFRTEKLSSIKDLTIKEQVLFKAWYKYHMSILQTNLQHLSQPRDLTKDLALDYLSSAIHNPIDKDSQQAKDLYKLVEAATDEAISLAAFQELVNLTLREGSLENAFNVQERVHSLDIDRKILLDLPPPEDEFMEDFAQELAPMEMTEVQTPSGETVLLWEKLAKQFTGESPYTVILDRGPMEPLEARSEKELAALLLQTPLYKDKTLDPRVRLRYQKQLQRQLQQYIISRHSSLPPEDYVAIRGSETYEMRLSMDPKTFESIIGYTARYCIGAGGIMNPEVLATIQHIYTYFLSLHKEPSFLCLPLQAVPAAI